VVGRPGRRLVDGLARPRRTWLHLRVCYRGLPFLRWGFDDDDDGGGVGVGGRRGGEGGGGEVLEWDLGWMKVGLRLCSIGMEGDFMSALN
jgi:hypothetical protein